MKKEVMEHPGGLEFLRQHEEEIDGSTVEEGMGKLYEYIDQSHDCTKCPNLGGRINHLKGVEPNLVLERGNIGISYTKCRL
ncbi:primosomal protein DnaI, partial [Planococcus sp. SIMBA_160]